MPKKLMECNLCGEQRELTADHIPPQCCGNTRRVKYYHFFEPQIVNSELMGRKSPRIFQAGIKKKTLCAECNNVKLGGWYDSELGLLCSSLDRQLKNTSQIQTGFSIQCKVNKVSRAVVGHLCAAFPGCTNTSLPDVQMREYFNDQKAQVIKGVHLYYWLHLDDNYSIMRNVAIHGDSQFNGCIMSILKFYPIAFLLSNHPIADTMHDIFNYTTGDIEQKIQLDFSLSSIRSITGAVKSGDWPFILNDDYVFCTSINIIKDSVFSVEVE
jgi:hypothetical protein